MNTKFIFLSQAFIFTGQDISPREHSRSITEGVHHGDSKQPSDEKFSCLEGKNSAQVRDPVQERSGADWLRYSRTEQGLKEGRIKQKTRKAISHAGL